MVNLNNTFELWNSILEQILWVIIASFYLYGSWYANLQTRPSFVGVIFTWHDLIDPIPSRCKIDGSAPLVNVIFLL